MTEFRYGLMMRPAGLGCVPREGLVAIEQPMPAYPRQTRHGVALFDRALTDAQIAQFELVPVLDAAGLNALATAVAVGLSGRYAQAHLDMANDPAKRRHFESRVERAVRKRYAFGVVADPAGLCAAVQGRLAAFCQEVA